jgi:hypothetical protein
MNTFGFPRNLVAIEKHWALQNKCPTMCGVFVLAVSWAPAHDRDFAGGKIS